MIVPRPKPPYPEEIRLSKLLLVEGETPAHFFEALLAHLAISDTIEIRSFGGNEKLQNNLSALTKSHSFRKTVKSIGIIRDAEDDANTARQSVESAVKKAQIPNLTKNSVFILPDNAQAGMIETLCLRSVSNVPHFHCVEEYIESARKHGASFPSGLALDKSRLQVYMAAHPAPQLYPGIAASRGFWPFAESVFENLREFLKAL